MLVAMFALMILKALHESAPIFLDSPISGNYIGVRIPEKRLLWLKMEKHRTATEKWFDVSVEG